MDDFEKAKRKHMYTSVELKRETVTQLRAIAAQYHVSMSAFASMAIIHLTSWLEVEHGRNKQR